MKRYDIEMEEDDRGKWVKYSEVKGIIHKHEQIAIENSDWYDCLKIDFDKQKEEIKKLNILLKNLYESKHEPDKLYILWSRVKKTLRDLGVYLK